jgi:dipeptidyl-peptidase-4
MMSYPNRSHGLYEGSGTTLHIKTMMTNYFNTHLKL